MTSINTAKMIQVKSQWLNLIALGLMVGFTGGCQNTGSNSGSSSSLDKFFSPLPGNNSAAPPPNAVTPQAPSLLNFGSPTSDKDPLLGGGIPLNRLPAQNTALAGNFNNPNNNNVPNLPSPSSSTSPAALATGNFSNLDPTRSNVTPVGATASAGVGATNSQFGSAEEFRALMQQLSTRGLAWQRLDYSPQTGDWKFYCAVKDPTQNGATRNFETTAKTDVAALKAVLEEINKSMPQK